MEDGENVRLATQRKNKDQAKGKGKAKVRLQGENKKESQCFFTKKKEHMKKECPKFKAQHESKVINQFLFVMNPIWLMFSIIHCGLTLVLQSTSQIPSMVQKP